MYHAPARPEHMLPMRLVVERTGLSADVLRAWERRYGVVTPGRSPGGQRWYSEADVARLRLLARAVEAGCTIGAVASLSDDDLAQLVRREEAAAVARTTPHALATQPHLADALSFVESLDQRALEQSLRQATMRLSIEELLDGVMIPLIRTVDEHWHRKLLTPAHEHLTTATVRRVLAWIIDQHEPAPDAPTILVTTPTGQWHELGAKLVAATAATIGWNVVYLGSNLPASVIVQAAKRRKVRAVALSIVYPEDDPQVDGELRSLREQLPEDVAIVVGGSGTPAYRPSLDAIGATVVSDLPSLRRWLQQELTH